MAKTRVHELAKLYGVESKFILEQLKEMGEFVKSPSSVVALPIELRLRKRLGASMAQPHNPEPSANQPPQTAASERSPSRSDGPADASAVSERAMPIPPAAPAGETPTLVSASSSSVRRVDIHSLSSAADLRKILRECKRAKERSDHRKLVFDFHDAEGFYPSVAVPAVALIQHFKEEGVPIELVSLSGIAEVMRLRNPLEASAANLSELSEPLSRMWAYFDHQQANALTTAFMDCMRRKIECQEGVLEALEWCLYEVLDNVMQHSHTGVGYTMLQLHVRSKRLVVCVSDTGIGVQRSLASSPLYRARTAFDALTMAVKEGVTRDKATNQGNGLFGLLQIVEQNGGKLNMSSGRGQMILENNRVRGDNEREFAGPDNHGTTLDFQLKVDKPVSLGAALNYEPTNMFLESLESPDGEHVISIRDQAGGAGSRLAARELKRLVMNVLNDGVPHVVLDFEGQAVVSSSFADEVIGKMFAEMGFNTFNQRIKLRNMVPTVTTLVDRAIALRLSQGSD